MADGACIVGIILVSPALAQRGGSVQSAAGPVHLARHFLPRHHLPAAPLLILYFLAHSPTHSPIQVSLYMCLYM